MGWDWLLGLVVFAYVTSVTPGPNNMMLLASGVNFGFRRTVPHIFGIVCGVSTLLAAMAFGLGTLFVLFPPLNPILKICGAAYLLWLAFKIATSGGAGEKKGKTRPMSFFEAAMFQWVNPKAWMMALGAIAGYFNAALPWQSGAALLGAFWLTGVFAIVPWAAFGQTLRRFLTNPRRLKIFNVTMGIALALSVIPMLM